MEEKKQDGRESEGSREVVRKGEKRKKGGEK